MYGEGPSSFLCRLEMQFGCCGDSCDPSGRAGKVYFYSFDFWVVFADFERTNAESCEQARQMRIGEINAYIKFRESIFIRSRVMIDFVAIL